MVRISILICVLYNRICICTQNSRPASMMDHGLFPKFHLETHSKFLKIPIGVKIADIASMITRQL